MTNKNHKKNDRFDSIKKYVKSKFSLALLFNIFGVIGILLLSFFIHFQYKMIIFPDSYHYYIGGKIILGLENMSKWLPIRGWGFPLIISMWIKLFGDNHSGLLVGSYIFYAALILISAIIYQKYINKNSKKKFLYFILFCLTIVCNTLIIGYSHTLLTESVVPALYMLSVLLLIIWFNISFKKKKFIFIFTSIILAFLGILIWFIKQPYAPAFYSALFFTSLLSSYKANNVFVLVEKITVIVISVLLLFVSILLWGNYIKKSVPSNSEKQTQYGYLSSGVLGGINVYYNEIDKNDYCNITYIDSIDISDSNKNAIKKLKNDNPDEWCDYLKVYEIRELDGTHVKYEVNISKDKNFSLINNSIFLINNIVDHPTYIIRSYVYNYLSIIDIQERDLSRGYVSSGKVSSNVLGENFTNGTVIYYDYYGTNNVSQFEYMNKFVVNDNKDNENFNQALLINGGLSAYLFKALSLLALPFTICFLVLFFVHKKEYYFTIFILSLMTFINNAFNVFMGAIIDRYVYAVFPLMILALLLLLVDRKNDD